MNHTANSFLKKRDIANSFNRACHSYDEAALMQRQVADNLFKYCTAYQDLTPNVVLDLGAGTGYCTQHLLQNYQQAHVITVDLAENMLFKIKTKKAQHEWVNYVCADAERLPFVDQSVDLIISNLMLHWCSDIQMTILAMRRILRPGGLLIFSTLGPQTLHEISHSWSQVDNNKHVHQFIDFSDLNTYLVNAQFSHFNLRKETLTLKFHQLRTLLYNLKALGTQNIEANRVKGLTGKLKFQLFAQEYKKLRDENDMFPLSYEVFYGLAKN